MVASDDPMWCMARLGHLPNVQFTVKFYPELSCPAKYFDLAVLSKCDHSILDYGTYGFWGAYLAGGRTILSEGHCDRVPLVRHAIYLEKLPGWETIKWERKANSSKD